MKKWPSPAKLNLFLYITGQREDNYHNLQTLFQFIDFCDYISYEARNDDELRLATPIQSVAESDNLIIIAAQRLRQFAHQHNLMLPSPCGFNISIDKRLPMGGGLGGGSSNAATTLMALNQLWNLSLSSDQLMQIGRKIGADVPLFIYCHSAFAQGVGDQLQKVALPAKWYLIVRPNIAISTAKIFTDPHLKRDSVTINLTQLLEQPFSNDCEPTVRKLYPLIDQLITSLSAHAPTRLTGTGSCIFSECESQTQAEQLQCYLNESIVDKCGLEEKVISFIAKGVNQSPLLSAI